MPQKSKLCFIHIPKCGGTSINEAIRRAMGLRRYSWSYYKIDSAATRRQGRDDVEEILRIRQQLLIEKLSKRRYKYVTGHSRCTKETRERFQEHWAFITILRDPVKRWISQYFFNTSKDLDHFKTDLDLDQYFDSAVGQQSGSIYVDFFTDRPDLRSDEAVAEAIENIAAFDFVGILEEMAPMLDSFEDYFRKELVIPRRNINPMTKGQMNEQLSPEVMSRIQEVCAPDQRIYEHFVRRSLEASR